MRPFLSIIIPYYNAQETIGRLLSSIQKSKGGPSLEVIVVDDGSKEKFQISNFKFQIETQDKKRYEKEDRHRSLNVIRLGKNMGPAVARNRGAREARGKFLVFLDSDVELFHDTLANLAKIYIDDPDIVAVTGVWVKEQRTRAFFPNFKALRDWSYWINERDKSGYYFLFSTRIASIKKSVFIRLGGFDERYPGALVEDIELTYRIARRYAIIFAPNVRVRHEFESFWPIAKKYFLRAYHWTKLYARRKKFDPVATTWWEAVTAVSGVGTVGLGLVSLVTLPTLPLALSVGRQAQPLVYQLAIINYRLFFVFLLIHLFLVRKFLFFLYQEKGFAFAVKGFFVGLVLYCFISAGAAWGKVWR